MQGTLSLANEELFWCWADTASRSRSQPKMEDNLFTSPKKASSELAEKLVVLK
jgi:hypothetical protein